jgi:methylated-DNA-[protein]-cysteine S-methyltransferase
VYQAFLETPVGRLQLLGDDHFLYRILFSRSISAVPGAAAVPPGHPLLNTAAAQISEYFAGTRRHFNLPLCPQGTAFQLQTWNLIRNIPYGRTRTYGELAAQLGNANKARAVGGAANKNPLPIIVPCHRVLGAGNRLTRFAGGLETTRLRLDLEHIPT